MKKRAIKANCKKLGMGLMLCRVDLSNSWDTNCIGYWKWYDALLTHICLDVFMISFQLGSPIFQHAAFSHPALHFSRLFACRPSTLQHHKFCSLNKPHHEVYFIAFKNVHLLVCYQCEGFYFHSNTE